MKYTLVDTVTPTANPQTLFQVLAPANQNVRILGVDLTPQGSTPASVPIPFDWIIQTTAGTGSTATAQKQDRGQDDSIRATLQTDFTSEPTASSVLIVFSLHQQSSGFWRPPFPLVAKGGERLGFRYKSAIYVPLSFTVYLEE